MKRVGPNQLALPAPDPGVVSLAAAFLEPSARVLDAGCGNGRNSIHLAKAGHEVSGIDKDPAMVYEALTWAKALGSMALKLSFRQSDMLELPYAVPSFEAVFATRSLQELLDRRQVSRALANLREVTVHGGYNLITAYVGTRRQQESKPHLTILNPDEVETIFTEAGWSIIHSSHKLHEPLALPTGETILGSYDQVVAQKPAWESEIQPQLDFTRRNNI